ncbi:PepSY domain-containing protein [Chroococcus sp. FPU101]|uniref:PepSY-associated TM helix domain-containing protein n=1 Tax=Chroococcus sp. FPU101 TaxID=1974212 RepID=UPI001A8D94C8|nr:PepSY domain-containing protein [Chroococcus sp. FPU101]GFE71806.1 hypothetical protein CFPU101_44160 [Chroococcus sp. FPU101]
MSNTADPVNPVSAPESPVNRFYRTVWRWHFYAGLFVIPFMLVLATTGMIYLFKPQLDGLMYHHLLFVPPGGKITPYTEQVNAVQSAYPNAAVSKIVSGIAPNRSTEVQIVAGDKRHLAVFVNPYTGDVLGNRNEDNNPQAIIRKIHGELMMGKWGDYLVELAACWALVLLLSGLYLWWPRNRFKLFGTFIPRLSRRNKRVFWRDLHAVSGFYGVLLMGFLILTGLPWSGFWGDTFAKVWSQFPQYVFDGAPQSTPLTGSLNQKGIQTVPWAVEQLPMPRSLGTPETLSLLVQHSHSDIPAEADRPENTAVNLDSIIAVAQSQNLPMGFSVSLPADQTGVYTLAAFPNDPRQERTMHIDQYSGQVLVDVGWHDYNWVAKSVEMGIAVHMGKYSLANQLLMLVACLIIILLCVSGAVMWWQHRPTGRLGAPAIPTTVPSWRVPLVFVALLGLAFPLVGFSLVAVLLLDYLVISRIPLLKRALN